MKIIRKLFKLIAGLIILLCLFVILCAVNPDLADVAGELLKKSGIAEKFGTELDFEVPEIIIYPTNQEQPTLKPLEIPSEVQNKSDYEKIEANTEAVSESDAKEIGASLSAGNTGDSLDFNKTYYPYYHMLSVSGKKIYSQIYANTVALNKAFSPATDINADDLYNVFEAVCNDHPELFWLDTTYACKYTTDKKVVEIELVFNKTADNIETSKTLFDTRVNHILDGASELTSVYDKELYLHDVLVASVEYDAKSELGQSAYSALVGGKSVCAGYARAFQYLCQQLDVPCYYVTGYSNQDHAWNIIKMNELFRNVDVTWDDTNPATKDYFNRTDAEISGTHVRTGLSINLPACTEAAGSNSNLPPTSELINPNPSEPLRYETAAPVATPVVSMSPGELEEQKRQQFIETNKLKESEVVKNLDDYYKRCYEKMVELGTGARQFTLYIPSSIWDAVQNSYSTGAYEDGYATSALETLKAKQFAIQLQMIAMKGDYIKVVHNVTTGKE